MRCVNDRKINQQKGDRNEQTYMLLSRNWAQTQQFAQSEQKAMNSWTLQDVNKL